MNEKIEYKGYWWLPSDTEKAMAGILTYIPHEEITLELIGNIDAGRSFVDDISDQKHGNIIHGFTSEAKEITLVNCFRSVSHNFSCPFSIINYKCQFLVIGKHMDDFKQECFFRAFVKIPALSYWCTPSVIKTTHVYNESDVDSISITFTLGKTIKNAKIDDNTFLNLKEGVYYSGDHYSPKLEQITYLEIVKQRDTAIGEFYSDIHLFEQFLSLATLHKVRCSEILLFDKSVFQELKDGKKHYHPIQFIYVQKEPIELPKFRKYDFLFSYESIAAQYPRVIRKWYAEKEDIAPIREHLIDSIKNKRVYTSVDFLIVIQAIEGFWWRFRDEDYRVKNKIPAKKKTELKTVIGELLKEFDGIGKIKTLDLDIEAVVDSRHYYSHFMNKSKKPKTLDGLELLHVTFKLRKLLICCVLNFIGFENTEINKILNDSDHSFINR